MYLVESLKYDVPALHEDRLTQVLCATFNESVYFKILFLKFLEIPNRPQLIAKTQVSNENAPSRPDLVIYSKDKPYILIESKVGAKSNREQQKLHSKLKVRHNFLLVRDPVVETRISKEFTKITWYELFIFLQYYSNKTTNPIDRFLVQKLISFGKACNMLLPDHISVTDFKNVSVLMTNLRLRIEPQHSFDLKSPFQSMDTMSMFLERCLIKLKDDPTMGSRLKSFKKRLKVSTTYDTEQRLEILKVDDRNERRELRFKTKIVVLEKEIGFKRSINGYSNLFVRISFIPYYRKKDITALSVKSVKKIPLNQITYRCEISAGLSDSRHSFFYEDSFTCRDNKELKFDIFYSSAIKNWKKKLKFKR